MKTEALPDAPRLDEEKSPGISEQTGQHRWLLGSKGAVNWVAEQELWLLGVAVPALLFPELVPKPVVTVALLLLPIPWICRRVAKGYFSVRTPMDFPIFGILVMLPASLYASVDLNVSAPWLYQIIAGVALFYGLVNSLRSAEAVWWMVSLLMAMGVIVSLTAPFTTRWMDWKLFSLPQVYKRFPLLLNEPFHPNVLAGALVMIVPLPLALLLFPTGRREARNHRQSRLFERGRQNHSMAIRILLSKPFLVFALAVIVSVLVLTQSRGAYVALVAIVFLGISLTRPRWVSVLLPVLLVGMLVVIRRLGTQALSDVLLTTDQLSSLEARREVWSRAIYMIQDFPYTGIGLGTFSRVGPVLYPYFLISGGADIPHAHNLFLQVGVDLGLPGLSAFVALLFSGMLAAWRCFRSHEPELAPALRGLATGLLCSLAAMVIHGMVDSATWGPKTAIVPWMLMGLIAALHRISALAVTST